MSTTTALRNAAWRQNQQIRAMRQDAVLIGTRRTVHERLLFLGLTATKVSRDLGHATGYLTTWLLRGTPKVLPEATLVNLARILQVTTDSLREQPAMPAIDHLIADLTTVSMPERSPATLRDVPLRSPDRPLGWPGADLVHALRPAHLAQQPPSFAFITGERHGAVLPVGSCVYIDIDKRPLANDLVAVYSGGAISEIIGLRLAETRPGPVTLWKVVAASFP